MSDVVDRPIHFCPQCGCNLAHDGPVELGNAAINADGELFYNGRRVSLARSPRLIASSLIRARGRALTCGLLAELLGGDIFDSTIVKYVERVRAGFRAIDPSFDQVQALRGFGAYRWATGASGGLLQ